MPSGDTSCRPGVANTGAGMSRNQSPGSFEKSMPPFCVTRIEPSAASAAPFAPPVVSAKRSVRCCSGQTRYSAPAGDTGDDDRAVGAPHRPFGERDPRADHLGLHVTIEP